MLTNQQLRERNSGIGGSDVAAICGLNPYKSALDLYLEKTGETEKENVGSKTAVMFGNFMEDFVLMMYSQKTKMDVTKPNKTYRHDKNKFMLANIDGMVAEKNIIVEAKTASVFQKNKWGEDGSDYIPDSYLMQVAHYAAVCDMPRVDIAVFFTDQEFKVYKYMRNNSLEKRLIEIEKDF